MNIQIVAARNRFLNDPDLQESSYETWVEMQEDDADTSWAAYQAHCREEYDKALELCAEAEADF
jgi:hypothetical protein